MPKLVISLPDAGEVVRELKEPQITVGRTEENTLQIEDISVSSHHAELVSRGAGYAVKDLDSTNGTVVNGQSFIGERMLRPGDSIRFGKVDTVYHSDGPAPLHPLPKEGGTPNLAAAAASSQRPGDFGNVSPFHKKQVKADPLDGIVIGLFVVAAVAFLASALVIIGC